VRSGFLACCFAAGAAVRVLAQEPQGFEAGVQGVAALASRSFLGAGLTGAVRPGGRLRLIISALPGTRDGSFAFRGEAGGHFMLNPERRRGLGIYGVGGIVALLGRRDAGYVLLGLGVESSPAGRSGWIMEAGVGGGVRIAIGWRRRWLRAPGR
jgi:hypothetical protein